MVARFRMGTCSACHLCDLAENSASCERVFALLRRLFGEQQMSALSDYLQTSLMLNFHDRSVG